MFKRDIFGTFLIIFAILLLVTAIPFLIVVGLNGRRANLDNPKVQIALGVYAFFFLLLAYTFFFTASGRAVLNLISFGEPMIASALFKHRMLYAKSGPALMNGLRADLDERDIAIMNAIFKQQKTNLDKIPGLVQLRNEARSPLLALTGI